MATIKPSELAPDEVVHYSFAGVEFDLGGSAKQSFDSDDRAVITNAAGHPWLAVEYPAADTLTATFRDQLAPEDDGQSAVNTKAFDVALAQATLDAQAEGAQSKVAIQAGLDQGEAVTTDTGGIAQTIAADENHEPAKSAKPFQENDPAAVAPTAATPAVDPAAAPDAPAPASTPDTTTAKGA
jgi:hypothetical protein